MKKLIIYKLFEVVKDVGFSNCQIKVSKYLYNIQQYVMFVGIVYFYDSGIFISFSFDCYFVDLKYKYVRFGLMCIF